MKKKIAFIGAGFIAQICHLPIYSQMKQVNLVAICDKDFVLAKKVAKKFNIRNVYHDHIEMLDNQKKLDAVVLVVPRHNTFSVSRDVLNKGINLFTEKPMALSLNSAKKLVQISERKKVRYVIGYMKRHDQSVKFLKKVLSKKKFNFNKINLINYNSYTGDSYANLRKHIKRKKEYKPNEITPELHRGFSEKRIKLNFLKFLNTHSHAINLLRYLIGDISSVGIHVNKNGEGSYLFKKKKIFVVLNTSYLKSKNWYEDITIVYNDYKILISFPPPMLVNQPAKLSFIDLKTGNEFKKFIKWSWSFENQARDFIKTISNKNYKSIVDGKDSINDIKLIESFFLNASKI